MSAILQAKAVAAVQGSRELFRDLDLVVSPGDVIGLVGANGAGKSTLLRILAGLRPPDEGAVVLSPLFATIGYLAQEPERRAGEMIREQLVRRAGIADAQEHLDAAAHRLAEGARGSDDTYVAAFETWLALGGADFDERLAVVWADLGIDVDLDATIATLSGGQSARVGLATLLLSRYDVYLLDEPTNDLDVDGLDRLEDFVQGITVPVVVVSHDREFLARTATSIIEIDRSLQKVATYGGGYDAYLEERSVARRQARQSYDDYAARRSTLEARARTQRAWMAKGVKNARRKSRDNDKIGRAFRAETSEKQAAKASQTDRLIQRLDEVEEPRKEWELQFSIAAAPRSGAVVAVANGIALTRGEFVLGPIDVQVDAGDRIAITGPNGAGKSTLIGLLLGTLVPDEGRSSLGPGVLVGQVDQARGAFDSGEDLGTAFSREVADWSTADVRTLLAKFGLGVEQVGRTSSTLSPGERTRAALALLQARGVNLLVLDEPTNHLDLPAIEQLEEALDSFDGTVLLVTHDRRMLDTVRLTRRWHLDDGVLTEIEADGADRVV